jgi:hypothetical protein
MRGALLLAALVALAAPVSAQARTYYVGPDGSDGHQGTSPASAWRTLDRVDARSFAAGDHVLFECGGTYDGRLRVRSSGTRQAPLVFGSYGSCNAANRPVIHRGAGDAGIDLSGVRWVSVEGLVVRGWTGADQFGVLLHDSSHIVLRSLFADGDTTGLRNPSSSTSVDVRIESSELRGRSATGLGIQNTSQTSTGWEVVDTEIVGYGDNCVLDWSGHDVWNRVSIHHCGYMRNPPTGKHGFYMRAPAITVENSSIYDISRTNGGACLSPRGSARIIGNDLHDSNFGVAFFDNTRQLHERVVIRRNRMWRQAAASIYIDDTHVSADSQSRPHTTTFDISNNTLLARGNAGADIRGARGGSSTSVTFDNNVLTGAHGAFATLRVFAGGTTGLYVGRGNDYWNDGQQHRFTYGASSSASPTLIAGEQGARTVSPDLVDPAGARPDLELRRTSPLLDVGVRDVAGLVLVHACDRGPDHYCGRAPEPGAYEILSAVAPQPPTVGTTAARKIVKRAATLTGTIKTTASATAYFEYGRTGALGSRTPAQQVAGGPRKRKLSVRITGLVARTTYHARLVATGPGGTVRASEITFTTA